MKKNSKIHDKNYFIDDTCVVSKKSKIYPGVVIEKNCKIGDNVTIQNSSLISNNVTIGNNCFIGPFSVIRENTVIKENVIVGPHCEITRSIIDEESKISHRTYIGDAKIGKSVFFGCGSVIANTNFKDRFKTKIGSQTKIGASTTLISPITIGKNCFVAAGTILSKNLKDNTKIRMKLDYLLIKN